MIAAKQSDKQNKYNRLVRDKKKSLAQKKERNYSHLVDFKRQTDSVGMEEMRGSCVAKNRKI
jgi:ABC-type phosphate transport system auxiliary subunit